MSDRIQTLIELALQEDIGTGDITTEALFGQETKSTSAFVVAKQDLVVSGLEIAKRVFLTVDPHLVWERYCEDGNFLKKGSTLAKVSGCFQNILKAERTALNFLQHLSGIATLTRRYVEAVKKYPVKILDTRKTLPGFRALEKHAVRCGGGKNHRLGLYDRYLIKDNHLTGTSIADAVSKAKAHNVNKVKIEVEIDRWDQIESAIASGADVLLLDNFSPKDLKKAVQQVKGRVPLEASGGITLENVLEYAKTGVDFISIGALTHSAPAADISLEIF